MRPPAILLLSPRVLKRVFLFRLSTHNSPCPASSWPFLESAVTAVMVFVSQHEEISTRAPHFCVAYQAPHTRLQKTEHMWCRRSAPCGRRRRNPCGRRRSAPCGRRRRNPCGRRRWIRCGRRRRIRCGCRRRNPSGRRRWIPCGHRRPALARMRRGRCPSSSTLRARPSANGSAHTTHRR
jgi:hypothetical protein